MGEMSADAAEFMRQLTGCQSQLYAYICSLTGNSLAAQNVLQETNLVLWDKLGDYDPTRPFLPWAYTFAYMQVLAWRKKRRRDRLVFDEDLLGRISDSFARREGAGDRRLDALENCMHGLEPEHRVLVDRRYVSGDSVNQIAKDLHKGPNVISAALYRIRKTLMDCIQGKLASEVEG
jgi:RNA polymerase sigma-70 factor (ECF subfamily)